MSQITKLLRCAYLSYCCCRFKDESPTQSQVSFYSSAVHGESEAQGSLTFLSVRQPDGYQLSSSESIEKKSQRHPYREYSDVFLLLLGGSATCRPSPLHFLSLSVAVSTWTSTPEGCRGSALATRITSTPSRQPGDATGGW